MVIGWVWCSLASRNKVVVGGEHSGVPYALTRGGELADPATARPSPRGYRCLACGGFVFVKQGPVRIAHFAHYADREVACSRETVMHEAAKRRLAEMLRAGLRAFRLQVACPGYTTAHGNHVTCSGENPALLTLRVPAFDAAGVEVPFGPYRLDAAASLADGVVLGLEVYQSHQVDEAKRAYLGSSGVPGLEVEAISVLEKPMPWRAVSSSLGEVRCPDCRAASARAGRERRRLEAQQRAVEERAKRDAARREVRERITFVAWDGRGFRTPSEAPVGAQLTCPACKAKVTVRRVAGGRVYLHAQGEACDAARAWVRAGMYAVYRQLTKAPEEVRILRRCSRHGVSECDAIITERPPDFDEVKPDEPSLLLLKDGAVVGQVAFARRAPWTGAPHRWWLKPSKAIKRPERWWQHRDGGLCPACQHRAAKGNERRRERERRERERVAAKERQERMSSPEHLEREPQMLEIARQALEALRLDPLWVAERGVVVRICERCIALTAYVATHGLEAVPPQAARALAITDDGEVRCRCMHCGHPGGNDHDRFKVLGDDLAGYELRPEAIRSLATPPHDPQRPAAREPGA